MNDKIVQPAAPAAGWLASLGHHRRVYVLPQFKLVYVSVAKNACTTLKWVMATLAGEDVASFTSGLQGYTSDEHAVHNRALFVTGGALYPDEVSSDLVSRV